MWCCCGEVWFGYCSAVVEVLWGCCDDDVKMLWWRGVVDIVIVVVVVTFHHPPFSPPQSASASSPHAAWSLVPGSCCHVGGCLPLNLQQGTSAGGVVWCCGVVWCDVV